MSGDFPMILTTGSAANGDIHPSDPLQNVNPSTNSMPVTYSHVHPSPVQGQESVSPLKRPAIEEEMGDGSGVYEQNEVHDPDSVHQTPVSRKRSQRHSPRQIQELEAFFTECPHPDPEQRLKLGQDLGMEPLQVKYWFQNKRTKTKINEYRSEIAALKAQRSELIRVNNELQAAVSRKIPCKCLKCQLTREVEELLLKKAEGMMVNEKLRKIVSMLDENLQTMVGASSPIPSPSLDSETQRMCPDPNPIMQLEAIGDVVIPSIQEKTNLMNLAKRLTTTFRVIISNSGDEQSWTSLSDCPEETIKVCLWRATEPGHAVGLFLSAVSTIQLPYSPQQVFNFLRDERCRALIDNPFNKISFHEVAHSADGSHPGSRISLLRIDGPRRASTSSESVEFMLQESFTTETESVVAYTSLDQAAVGNVMTGTDTSIIPIHPLGYIIAPLNHIDTIAEQVLGTSGIQQEYSGLTVFHQFLVNPDANAEHNISTEMVADRLRNVLHQIRRTICANINIM